MGASDFFRVFRQDRIVGGAFVLALLQFGASFLGLIRDRLLASTFPGLHVVDVYIASFRPSDLIFQMMIMSAFSVAMVPLLSAYYAKKNDTEMMNLLHSVMSIAAIVFGTVSLLLAILFPFLASYIVGFEGEDLVLYINFARLALFTNFLFVFGNAYGQYLITIQRYWVYGITPMLYTLGTIGGTVFLTEYIGAYGPMIGTLCGAVLYVVLRAFAVLSRYGVSSIALRWSLHPDIRELLSMMWPRMAALGALQFQLLFFDAVASGLDAGSVTINAYARNFQAVAVGVAGIALAQSVYSLLSQSAAKKQRKRYFLYLKKGINILLLVTIPGAIALVFLAPIAARIVSLEHVLPVFTWCLTLYAVSIPFESVNHLLLRAYYATKHTAAPAVFSVLNGTVAIAIAWMYADSMGVYSLALGFTIGQIVQLVGLAVGLPSRAKSIM